MTLNMSNILAKIHHAAQNDYAALSTGEALIAALVLDRADWLIDMKFTIAEALDRIGPQWAELIPEIARLWNLEQTNLATRFSYEILPRTEAEGGAGYQLRLLDNGQEVGGGRFPATESAANCQFGGAAYSEAVAAAHAWLDSKQTPPTC